MITELQIGPYLLSTIGKDHHYVRWSKNDESYGLFLTDFQLAQLLVRTEDDRIAVLDNLTEGRSASELRLIAQEETK